MSVKAPRPVTYAEAMDALHDAYLTLLVILQLHLDPQTRARLELLRDRLARVVVRDDGRGRERSPDRYD
jgi:hypothetical protein